MRAARTRTDGSRAARLSRALLAGLAILLATPMAAPAAAPVQLNVSFGPGARLGGDTSMNIWMHVSPSLAPVTEFRLLTAGGITLTSSHLGLVSCRRPSRDITRVRGPVNHSPCPANSLMATGSATAGLRLDRAETIYGAGFVELHAGASVGDKPGLVAIVDTYNPVRMQLTYAGYLYVPPPEFGVGLAMMVPPIPRGLFDSPIALSTLHLAVGGDGITYHRVVRGRDVAYHPDGVPLPESCPASGFRFRAIVRFADGGREAVDDLVRCPPHRVKR